MEKCAVKGIITAMVTPFHDDGLVDYDTAVQIADWHCGKSDALFVLGTSGEGMLLTYEERSLVVKRVAEAVDGRIPLIAHTGAITTAESIKLTEYAVKAGVVAVSAITPYYFRLGEKEITKHLLTVARAAGETPFFLYNNPATAGNIITPEIVRTLRDSAPNFSGIKDSSKSIENLIGYKKLIGQGDSLFVGGDRIFQKAMSSGVDGAVSTVSNLYPELFRQIYDCCIAGDEKGASEAQNAVNRVLDILTSYPYFAAVKYMLKTRNLPESNIRPPVGALSKQDKYQLESRLEYMETSNE
ncbi:MAG: dihydrodipicolinate synthase family protein [Bacteroidetes bacterium]|nr:dihydrodipicolinate synthase family protein [Bacteroidota bacterium]